MSRNDAIASVDGSDLADQNILGLRLRDFDFGLELGRLDDLRQCGTGADALAGLQRLRIADLLQDTVNAGAKFGYSLLWVENWVNQGFHTGLCQSNSR